MGTQQLDYQQEFLRDIKRELHDLFDLHWREIALNQEKIALNPDWETYHALEDSGKLQVFTARQSGRLVGYVFTLQSRHLHYKDHIMAITDLIYLHPDFRRGWAASKLFRFVEKCLVADGVSMLTMGMKHHKPFSVILERMGYSPHDVTYSKYIGD